MENCIRIRGARQNNLKNISLDIPLNQFVVVTGVSGSGKSSLAFDVIAREGQRRYLETFSSFSRQYIGKMARPEVEMIEGLSPVITISQRTIGNSSRSTVGTMSDLYDMLRLLFARLGKSDSSERLTRSLFSFNTATGACPACHGLGLEEKISLKKIIHHPERSIRQGALAPTQPNGYIMYSQVTVDVLNQICQAHGFNTDIPWCKLSVEQQNVILYGSTALKVPFGKHPLESRLKWTGITAKPREEDYYKGIVTIMTDILRRDRNDSILRFVESVPCSKCKGTRLNEKALGVTLNGKSIDLLSNLELVSLRTWLNQVQWAEHERAIADPVIKKMSGQIELMTSLGLGHLSLNRPASSLSGGESQRIRLINQVYAELSNILYVFDEPTLGLHPEEIKPLLLIFRKLVNSGNTVMVVEHDETTIRHADWIIDIGPGAGKGGGEVLFNGYFSDFFNDKTLAGNSPSWDLLHKTLQYNSIEPVKEGKAIIIENCSVNNLKNIDIQLLVGKINVVTGVSGSGRSTLVHQVLEAEVREFLSGGKVSGIGQNIRGLENTDKIITIDQAPIGRTPRSNPATYTGLADKLRDLYAKLPESLLAGYTKSHFSFNTVGGRCETCQGAGSQQIGMHFLGNVDVICPSCNGKRFHDDILQIKYKGKDISEVLDLSVNEAISFFSGQPQILKYLLVLRDVGLGYIHLGQASSTLSGGEAQRIKLATELQQKDTGKTLYLFDEPTTGLHAADIQTFVKALHQLTARGNTVVCIEQDPEIIRIADRIIELGPGSGENGGFLLFQGTADVMQRTPGSLLGEWVKKGHISNTRDYPGPDSIDFIELYGVNTHYLKNIEVKIPKNKLTVITGLSGSGKSSLAFDTLYSEARSRFVESLSSYTRSLIQQSNHADIAACRGLGPVVAISRKHLGHSSRSTVGTTTGIYDYYRLLFSRISFLEGKQYSARHFSFNNETGACPGCGGLGYQLKCSPEKLITHPGRSVLDGAMMGHKAGLFYGDPFGQYIAALKAAADHLRMDISMPWDQLTENHRGIILYGTGDKVYDFNWEYKNKTRAGEHRMRAAWPGFCNLADDEYQRKHLNKNTRDIEELLDEITCPACHGGRLKPELLAVKFHGMNIAGLSSLNIKEALAFFNGILKKESSAAVRGIIGEVAPRVTDLLTVLLELGTGYLTVDRNSRSLSGGEGQRVRLAGALSARLCGVTYVFDEPTIGLHVKDTLPLIGVIQQLISNGNTAIVIEHDEQFIRAADYILDMGPGAGTLGGQIIAAGTLEDIIRDPRSVTGRWLTNPIVNGPINRQKAEKAFGVRGAFRNNLKNIDVDFISNGIIAVTGVSGSGKSTLVNEVVFASASAGYPVGCKGYYGFDHFDKVVMLDQQPLSANSLSTPATYTGFMDELRDLLAVTKEARDNKFSRSSFSYLTKDGKCPECNGVGQIRTSMDFMSDIWTTCESCGGSRFRSLSLIARLENFSVADILQMTVDECLTVFNHYSGLKKYLLSMHEVGIGHLQLGQSCETLSGGESQRLRLATELISLNKGNNLYLFDEPTTGLHAIDIQRLIHVFNQLADSGHTLIFIEHNPLLTAIANQVIQLGPGSGPEGGYLVASEYQ
ncbi:MAG: hypothetical protein AB9842_11800 [Bacteroidales bacterium]